MPRYSKSVLLIDDDPSDRKLFSRMLRKAGFEVAETASVEAAMAMIVSGDIGCVVTDQVMPINGLEVARSAQNVRRDLALIFISGGPPKVDLPEGALFITKDNHEGLRFAVEKSMRPFLIDG